MTQLRISELNILGAKVGPDNPFPPIGGDASLNKQADLSNATETIRTNAAYGRVASISPYLIQDGYTREHTEQRLPAIMLENEHLSATFLPSLGGRLWSLIDRPTGHELLYRNPILQPANLALRNAWLAGGVEWNIGTIGHTPLTCAPLHSARIEGIDGSPGLRLYEFERLRRVIYQIDVHLPPDSTELVVHVRIVNPNDTDVPMYWWSNIAVPQSADTRVIAPADATWNYSYDNILRHDPVAPSLDKDISYPARFTDAADFFFDLTDADEQASPWIAAVERDGTGLLQTSTRALTGRKLFRWGTSSGGQRWQEWLAGPVTDRQAGYAEIQAGLAATQFEHVRMPAGATLEWTETYCALTISPSQAHGDWNQARAAVAARITRTPQQQETLHQAVSEIASRAPAERLHDGSGWGALEHRVRQHSGEAAIDRPATPFHDDTLGAKQQSWMVLLETGRYPDLPADELPASMHIHPVLCEALEKSAGWAAPALAAATYASQGDWEAAAAGWQESLHRTENAYARRNLAVAQARLGDQQQSAQLYLQALADLGLGSGKVADSNALRALVCEALPVLIGAGQASEAIRIIASLPTPVARLGRVRMLTARAELAHGDAEGCASILRDTSLEVADLREGEESLDALWWDCHAALRAAERGAPVTAELRSQVEREVPLPEHLDFRMKPQGW